MVWDTNTVTFAVALATIIGNGIGWLVKTWYDKRKRNDIIQKALKALLRRELSTQHDIYTTKGSISRIGLQEFENTLEIYESLVGANGYVQDIADDIRDLKVRT